MEREGEMHLLCAYLRSVLLRGGVEALECTPDGRMQDGMVQGKGRLC